MKNILIINQPINNRGDEAAHRSLLRSLDKNLRDVNIIVLFVNQREDVYSEFIVESPRIKYINITSLSKGYSFTQRWSLRLNMLSFSLLYPTINKFSKYVKSSDLIICAPGGICMGSFQDWSHIFNLMLCRYYKKPIIYYSRSFGPFPEKTTWNRTFKKISYKLLDYFNFISIRDSKTMKFADKLNLNYIPSIDTAFLDNPTINIPNEIRELVEEEKYVVFVPNSLTWHPAYKEAEQNKIDNFYRDIIHLLLSRKYKIIMLPQLYKTDLSDYNYFNQLVANISNSNIVIIDEIYSSDIQQFIIANSELVIGARYHTIVFAINNTTPFISLSYEHKMSGMLETLMIKNREIDISQIGKSDFDYNINLKTIENFIDNKNGNQEQDKAIARNIAKNTFDAMIKKCRIV